MEVVQVATGGGVLLILLTVMFYNQMQVTRASRQPSPRVSRSPPDTMMGRYASHRGHVVGQVVAVTTDKLVLRQGGTHKAVPLSQAHAHEGDIVLEGDIDWAAAEDAGRAWAGANRPTESPVEGSSVATPPVPPRV